MKSVWILPLLVASASSFQAILPFQQRASLRDANPLFAKKKNKKASGQGFAPKQEVEVVPPTPAYSEPAAIEDGPFLQSVATGGSTAIPTMETTGSSSSSDEEDTSNLTPNEKAQRILREKYGMKTLEEQQLTKKQMENLQEQRKKLAEMKRKAELNEEIDIIAMIPGPVQIAIDRTLKAGVAITGVLFILAGLAITVEAWSKTSGTELPPDIDAFISETVEPNFTTGLLVLLGFSVSLGAFAAAQLGSKGAQYREQ